jgi:hypothetical protein
LSEATSASVIGRRRGKIFPLRIFFRRHFRRTHFSTGRVYIRRHLEVRMRWSLVFTLLFAACSDHTKAPKGNADLSATAGNEDGGPDDGSPGGGGDGPPGQLDSAQLGDGAPNLDLANRTNDLGPVGASCVNTCDCMPGLGCFNNKCEQGFMPVYCCASPTCPAGSFCENPTGSFGQCGGGRRDLAVFDPCPFIGCNMQNMATKCAPAGCTQCVMNQNGPPAMVCAK